MNSRKIGPNKIPIEVQKYLKGMGVKWLTDFFNKIWQTKNVLNKWKKTNLVPETRVIFKVFYLSLNKTHILHYKKFGQR